MQHIIRMIANVGDIPVIVEVSDEYVRLNNKDVSFNGCELDDLYRAVCEARTKLPKDS